MAIAKREQIVAWVEAARQGDRSAFAALVGQFQDAVAGVIVARLGRTDAVEDIAQETFLAAFRQLATLTEPAKFGAWVCGIARNLALKWHRDRRPMAPLPPDVSYSQSPDRADTADDVMNAVGRLPHDLREPLTLFYIDGYSTGEVADFLAIPSGTVRRRLHDARRRLRGHLETTMADEIKKNALPPEFATHVVASGPNTTVSMSSQDATFSKQEAQARYREMRRLVREGEYEPLETKQDADGTTIYLYRFSLPDRDKFVFGSNVPIEEFAWPDGA